MKNLITFLTLHGLLVAVLSWSIDESAQSNSICSWTTQPSRSACPQGQFQCLNLVRCISRSWYCDRADDCGDNSDEKYCSNRSTCPTNPLFAKCDNADKCIPYEWICNGYSDCPSGDDEFDCGSETTDNPYRYVTGYPSYYYSTTERPATIPNGTRNTAIRPDKTLKNILKWLKNQKSENSAEKWGPYVDRIALLFHFAYNNVSITAEFETDITYELNIQMLSRLSSSKLEDISSTELASYVNAFLVTCSNPRDFYGHDIVGELRNRVNQEEFTNPYVLLALCNAGEIITETDKNKLTDIFHINRRIFWTDMQAIAVMALSCASKQPESVVTSEILSAMTLELKQRQQSNGSVDNLQATALVLQALIATDSEKDPDSFDEKKALQIILQNQNSDGSFGDLMTTLLVAPILTCRSLANIDTSGCHYESRDENSALEDLSKRTGPKIPVQYSLWFGDEKDLERNLILRVPEDTSLYGIMELAAEIDSRFKFDYSVKNNKPYVNAISGMRDNPLTGKFWFLYSVQDGEATPMNESPADITPTENDQYVLWYKRGTWVN